MELINFLKGAKFVLIELTRIEMKNATSDLKITGRVLIELTRIEMQMGVSTGCVFLLCIN